MLCCSANGGLGVFDRLGEDSWRNLFRKVQADLATLGNCRSPHIQYRRAHGNCIVSSI